MPDSTPVISGIVDIRGTTLSVIDLSLAIGKTRSPMADTGYLIVSEYNNNIQGFHVSGVDRIVNMNWADIKPPPNGLGKDCYLTSIAEVDNQFVGIIDVEKVMSELNLVSTEISEETRNLGKAKGLREKFILIVDDSFVARKQIIKPMEELGINYIQVENGRQALDYLNNLVVNDPNGINNLALVISDVEMPTMDGYTLVTEIRKSEQLKDIYVILHSSLSGVFNQALIEKVGADDFIAKYDADILSKAVVNVFENYK
jgi:two-component system chemotaxis response regulator CheV